MAKMSQQNVNQIVQALQNRGVTAASACRECGKKNWEINDTAKTLPALDLAGNRSLVLTQGIAVATITCSNCGHIRLFNLTTLGVTPPTGGGGQS